MKTNTDITELLSDGIMSFINALGKDYRQWFKDNYFMANPPSQTKGTHHETQFTMLKYFEHNSNWTVGARQCRGLIVYECDDGLIIPVRGMLERGAEVLSDVHTKHGITETQDIIHGKMLQLAPSQQQLAKQLSTNNDISAFLSFKTDGSLLNVTWIRTDESVPNSIELYTKIHDIIEKYGDDFAKVFLYFEKKFGKLIILSSQTTLLMHASMQDYTVHAIMATIGFSEIDITKYIQGMTPAQALYTYCEPFFANINSMCDRYKISPSEYSINFMFESVVANRTTAWGKVYTNLAIAYPVSIIKFIGCTNCSQSDINFIPHFEMNDINYDFREPCWWKISKSSQVNAMIELIDSVLHGNITIQDFFTSFPPNKPRDTYDIIDFDCEGFVIYTPSTNGNNLFEYNKIKTNSYYSAHKFHFNNIDLLITLAKTAGNIFPLTKNVNEFFLTAKTNLFTALTIINNELDMYDQSQLFTTLSEKAQVSFKKQPLAIQRKMLINASLSFREFCMNVFIAQFKQLSKCVSDNDIIFETLKILVVKHNIITNESIEAEFENIKSNIPLKKLLALCINVVHTNDE
ncbi:hypothetical protein BMW23_0227 [Bodo saltans virus]|uniref:Uncharacterized protein n=1 Tax=Bodo saltans virus TaxID=2024608 RepID=A0A2H4UTZ0_9VIRU|nr:hypothetical protein QJ851_gp0222 [Bodo saltans virus]ATZ80285.1 hypothetical protein BMW23_0227 [Bodo saltans virus]